MGRISERTPRPSTSGFTLIEIVVVLLIITIMLGLVGMNLTRNPADTLHEEADRLARVLQNAQQEAILEGRLYGFAFSESSYLFARPDPNAPSADDVTLVPIQTDELLGPHRLPAAMTLTWSATNEKQDSSAKSKEKRVDQVVFDPSGEFPVFQLTLSIGDLYWYVRGQSDGQVVSSPLAEAPKT